MKKILLFFALLALLLSAVAFLGKGALFGNQSDETTDTKKPTDTVIRLDTDVGSDTTTTSPAWAKIESRPMTEEEMELLLGVYDFWILESSCVFENLSAGVYALHCASLFEGGDDFQAYINHTYLGELDKTSKTLFFNVSEGDSLFVGSEYVDSYVSDLYLFKMDMNTLDALWSSDEKEHKFYSDDVRSSYYDITDTIHYVFETYDMNRLNYGAFVKVVPMKGGDISTMTLYVDHGESFDYIDDYYVSSDGSIYFAMFDFEEWDTIEEVYLASTISDTLSFYSYSIVFLPEIS